MSGWSSDKSMKPANPNNPWKTSWLVWIGLAVLFMAITTQAPLYSSNQNQYFLHGMAQAGLGSLADDWLASTREPTPLFTLLVKWTFLLFKQPAWFYVWYTILMGIYFYCLVHLTGGTRGQKMTGISWMLPVTLLLLIHSAALRFLLSRLLGTGWAFLFDGGVAGQRLLGTVLQPSAFGVLLIAALLRFRDRHPFQAGILTASTAVIHPTYLLTSALMVLGFMVTLVVEEKSIKKPLQVGAIALVIVSPILAYIFTHFWGANPEEAAYAREILVYNRLPHHALASTWADLPAFFRVCLVIAALALTRKNRLLWIPLLTIFLGASALTLIQVVSGNEFLALVFPWRPSALLVPVSSSILVFKFSGWLLQKSDGWPNRMVHWLQIACITLMIFLAAAGGVAMQQAVQARQDAPSAPMTAWVREHSEPGDRFLIPVNLETFRTSTLRPIYIDYFAIPYSDSDVIQWYHRVLAANKFYATADCNELFHLRDDERLTHVVTETGSVQPDCRALELVYQDPAYTVYRAYVAK